MLKSGYNIRFMKKIIFLVSVFCFCFFLNGSARGGFRMSGRSFRSSGFRTHSNTPKAITRPVGRVRVIRPTSFYHQNPSYRMVNNRYYPVYHRSPNYLLWYFVLFNHRTHRNDTIRAKSKEELDRKVKSTSTEL